MIDFEKEIHTLEKKLADGAATAEVYLRLAELYDATGKPHRSHAVLKRQLEKGTNPASAYFGIGMLHEKYGDEQAALDSYMQSSEQDSTFRPARAAIRRINLRRLKKRCVAALAQSGKWIMANAGFLTMYVLTPLMIILVSLLAVDTAHGNSLPAFTVVIKRIAVFAVSFIVLFVTLKYYK